MNIECVGIIGLGEVGRILSEDLLAQSPVSVRVWDHEFGTAGSKAAKNLKTLAGDERLSVAESAEEMSLGCQLLLSAVTADQAVNAAQSILPSLQRDTVFIDLNSVSPGAKQEISDLVESVKGRFVEAAVMSPIMPLRSGSPILLSGPNAGETVSMLEFLGFHAVSVASDEPGVASATKMCRSVIVKGMEALVSESLLAARHYGVEESVLGSLSNLFPGPDWPQHAQYLISRTLLHGERRAAEMREVVNTVREAGCDPLMSAATVERQAWAAQFQAALDEESLGEMLDAIRAASVCK
ncbi:DUF1932 domain-containing protein [Congregibacter sp.]|uniref:NAD(P)-dependent oxidoreductase n=1 Tax=Congregibacter sp. TaxID=2744308 RepID=UPI0038592757